MEGISMKISELGGSIAKVTTEIHSMMPDSLLFGSFLLYVLTQHAPFGVFALFVLELILSHKLIGWVMAQSVGAPLPPGKEPPIACRMGYKIGRMDFQRLFSHSSYPSFGMFSIMGVVTYLSRSMMTFSETLDAMGPVWASRKIVAMIFSICLILVVLGGRIYGCESTGEILLAAALGVGAGLLLYSLHLSVFGEQGMNFLGLPYLVTKESQGTPIYVCHTSPR